MKSLKNFSSNALVAPDKVMGGVYNGGYQNYSTLADLYPTGLHSGSFGGNGPALSGDDVIGEGDL